MKTSVFLAGLAAAVVWAAEASGQRGQVYAGAGGGALLGLAGLFTAAKIAARSRAASGPPSGGRDIWAIWGVGMLARIALLALLAFVFWRVWGGEWTIPMLSLAGAYLALLAWETAWLYGKLKDKAPSGS